MGWDAPRHLTLFSQVTLEKMLARTGFRVQRMMCISGSYPTFALSVRFWAQERFSVPVQERLPAVLGSALMRVLVIPYFYLMDSLGKGTVVTAVARPCESEGFRAPTLSKGASR